MGIDRAINNGIKFQRMGKEREGKFHPLKGKPSASRNQKGIVTPPVDRENLNEQIRVEEEYNVNPDSDRADGARLLHPNRNVQKDLGQSRPKAKGKFIHKSIRSSIGKKVAYRLPDELSLAEPRELFKTLSQNSGDCISVYLPVKKTARAINLETTKILFKNSIQKTVDKYEVDRVLLHKMNGLLNNEEFWQRVSSQGLGIYFSKDFFSYVNLPQAPDLSLHVSDSFNVIPLVPYLSPSPSFFLLALSKNGVKVFKGDQYELNHLKIEGMPNGMSDVIHFEEQENHNLFRTESAGAGEGASYHGMGGGAPDEKKNIEMYLAEVDKTLWSELLHGESAPLLIASVYYIATMYRQVSRYKNVLSSVISGNWIQENEHNLHRNACELLDRYFEEDKIKALARYYHLSATSLTTDNPEQIISAGFDGRIDTLFLPFNKTIWGKFDTKTRKLSIVDQQQEDSEDLLNATVFETIMNGGAVYILNPEAYTQGPMAILRY